MLKIEVNEAKLIKYIKGSISYVDAYKKYIRYVDSNISYSTFRKRAISLNCDTSHFHNKYKGTKLPEHMMFNMGKKVYKRLSSYTKSKYKESQKRLNKYSCACCGIKGDDVKVFLQLDHITPIAITGYTWKPDTQWLCGICHDAKSRTEEYGVA